MPCIEFFCSWNKGFVYLHPIGGDRYVSVKPHVWVVHKFLENLVQLEHQLMSE